MIISKISQLNLDGIYSYADYLTWTFTERVELVLGKIFPMSPAPGSRHQHAVKSLMINLELQLKRNGSTCMAFPAPFDVVFPGPKGREDTVLQPDITVVCDRTKIRERGCFGVPDLVIEVISPASLRHDVETKFSIYESFGVQEYWIVYPVEKNLIVYQLNEEGKYQAGKPITSGDAISSSLFPEMDLDLEEVFRNVVYEPNPASL